MKRYKLICCKVLQREIAWCMVKTNNYIDLTFLRQELHETPEKLREALQKEIDIVESGHDLHSSDYGNEQRMKTLDAIIIGYGLCSNALVGLHSSKVPLVIPRCHDCTTLMMGSKEAYREYFDAVKGTSFLTRGWLDNGQNFAERNLEQLRAIYMEKYQDEEAVEFLLEMEAMTMGNYEALTCIYWPELPDPELLQQAKEIAKEHGWEYKRFDGNSSLVQEMLNGDWDPEKFLIVQPGQTVKPSYDELIIKAE